MVRKRQSRMPRARAASSSLFNGKSDRTERTLSMHILKPRISYLLLGVLLTLVANSLAQTSAIVCPGSWKQVSSSGPPSNFAFDMAFEPRDHVVLFGGTDLDQNRKGDTWTWDGTAWIHAA